jgi:hypothetical protein
LLRSFLSLEEAGNTESAKDSVRYRTRLFGPRGGNKLETLVALVWIRIAQSPEDYRSGQGQQGFKEKPAGVNRRA